MSVKMDHTDYYLMYLNSLHREFIVVLHSGNLSSTSQKHTSPKTLTPSCQCSLIFCVTFHSSTLTSVCHGKVSWFFMNKLSASENVSSEWALSDQLVFSTVSALLRVCNSHQRFGESAIQAILRLISEIVKKMKAGTCE
jgi:hypothetical protein